VKLKVYERYCPCFKSVIADLFDELVLQ
jgi:hypothetical protein